MCGLLFFSCSQEKNADVLVQESELEHVLSDNEKTWIEEVSPKRIGRMDSIIIRFTKDFDAEKIAESVSVAGKVKGSFESIDSRTLQFIPTEAYKINSKITVSVAMQELFPTILEEELNAFDDGELSIDFISDFPSYSVDLDGISVDADGKYQLTGVLETDIPLSLKEVSKVISATIDHDSKKTKLDVSWNEVTSTNNREFFITIDTSSVNDRTLAISWEGTSLGVSKEADVVFSGFREFLIPKAGEFEVLHFDDSNDEYISIDFSEPLETTQDLRGFVTLYSDSGIVPSDEVRIQLNGNNIIVFNDDGWDFVTSVTVNEGILAASYTPLKKNVSFAISNDWEIPEVKFPSYDSAILPTTNGSTAVIETKNLTGVLVEAYHMRGESVLQFLQVNELTGNYLLDRVGEPVWIKSFDLEWDSSMKNKYIMHGLDLTELTKQYPDGMFQIRVTFRHRNIMYNCPEDHEDFSHLQMPGETEVISYYNQTPYWKHDDNYYPYSYGYRKDPCHPNFYDDSNYNSIVATQNILISDIGIMAKKTDSDRWYITTADLRTTDPLENTIVEMYSYTGKKLTEGKTNKEGGVILTVASPAFIVARNGEQTSYLKLSTTNALNASHFDVGGEKAINGVKGFLYGERDVWRPGDSIYLTFILDDKQKHFPKDFPITFELSDPSGKVTDSKIIHSPVDGFYAIETQTLSDAKTGNWTATIKAGGQEWGKTIKIETLVPNRLSVDLELDKPYLTRTGNSLTLTGAWLHGAPVPGYKAEVSGYFYSVPTEFEGYKDFVFTDFDKTVSASKKEIWDGMLGSNSKTVFPVNFDKRSEYPGKMKVQMVSTIFEPSGLFSTEPVTFDYEPYDKYVGLKIDGLTEEHNMLLTDVDNNVQVVALTNSGELASNTWLEYTISKLEWKWWWEKDALTDATLVRSYYDREVDSGPVYLNDGKGNFSFNIDSSKWGRYLITVTDEKGGHSASQVVYVDEPNWRNRDSGLDKDSASMLNLTQDKELYNVGETAVITFPSNENGKALITVEKNGEVVSQEWLPTQAETTKYEIPLTEDYAPNIYVHVSLVQPHLQTENSLPIRMYGILPIMVENSKTRLQPTIVMPDSYEPNKEATITVSEQNGKPMTFTLAVVEEGLLGLTNFKAPNPWDEFYKKESSTLLSWDIYDYVINAFGGKLETLLSIGGAEAIIENPESSQMRFKPVVRYFGPFELDANASKEISFTMPEYIGSVRAMVVAGKDSAYGVVEKSVPVKSDLMVLPALPRTLGLNEILEVPITVFNGTNENKTVEVCLDSSGALEISHKTTIEVRAKSEAIVSFTLETEKEGWSEICVTASSGKSTASNTTEIETIGCGIPVYKAEQFVIDSNSDADFVLDLTAEASTYEFSVELSSLPPIDLSQRLSYLIRYPHGCLEQITSAGFPQLYVADFVKSTPKEIDEIKKNVQAVINKYSSYQTPSGGFAYWPGRSTSHGWASSYAGHFMIEAKKAGYNIPVTMYNSWLSWQKQQASKWTEGDTTSSQTQAYRLYTLALAGESDIGAMNRLKALKKYSVTEQLMLAAAYAISGHKSTAKNVLEDLNNDTVLHRDTGGSFSSSTRDIAMRLYVYDLLGDKANVSKNLKAVSEELSSDNYMNTQEIAWSLIALLPYYSNTSFKEISFDVVQENTVQSDSFKGGSVVVDLVPSLTGSHAVTIKNTGEESIYGKVTVKGTSIPGSEDKKNEGLQLSIAYFNENAERISPEMLKIGDNFTLSITVKNKDYIYNVENLALTIPIPTGWELFNQRIIADDYTISEEYDYQDIRDDVIYTYFSLDKAEQKSFYFNGTVTHTGAYHIPAIYVEAMYDDAYSAVYPGVNANK